MFPLNDFNVVCCALATFSAAVGYNVSRRRRSVSSQRLAGSEKDEARSCFGRGRSASISCSSDSTMDTEGTDPAASAFPSPSQNACDDTEPGTLKRKSREDDDNTDLVPGRFDVDAAPRLSSPPKKRCRTPPEACDESSVVKMEEAEPMKLEPPSAAPISPKATVSVVEDVAIGRSAPPSLVAFAPLPSSYSIPAAKPSSAFTAFANTRSTFAFTPIVAQATSKPIWCTANPIGASNDDPHNVAQGESGSAPVAGPSAAGSCDTGVVTPRDAQKSENPLAAHAYAKGTHTTITGEEDEDVHAEVKGAKVFIKRGAREFSDGIHGHAKLLTHRATGEQRILFRREPIWKVSMSVRLRSAVRCTFDAEQGILRVALKEAEAEAEHEPHGPGSAHAEQVVVYALKRGKASKSDFAAFAQAVIESARLSGPARSAESMSAA